MIGNDLIDLKQAKIQSNWRRKGYLEKVYSDVEQEMIASFSDPEIMVWILWSMKEASYKANNRITNTREYAPSKIKCTINQVDNNIYLGTAQYNNLEYNCKTEVFADYILTIALYNSDNFNEVQKIFLKNFPKNYIQFVEQNNYLKPAERIIKNTSGIPYLNDIKTKKIKPLSISHHGNFLSLVFI